MIRAMKFLILPMLLLWIASLQILPVNANNEIDNFKDKKTNKQIIALITKHSSEYLVKSLEIYFGEIGFASDYKIFSGKISNGVIYSFKGKSLAYFNASTMDLIRCDSINGCNELSDGEIQLKMPYFPNAKFADIYNRSGAKILTIDLSLKATCNENEICNRPLEDSLNCPQDCKDNQPIIDIPVTASPVVVQETFWEKIRPFAITIVVLFVLACGIAYVISHMRTKNE